MAAPLQIVVEDDSGRRQVVAFTQDEIAVGRDAAGNGLCLPERNVSRRHARFVRANGAVFVEDLESANGTLVNGERLTGRRRIREGDLVQIGDYDLAIEGSQDRAHDRDTGPTGDLPAVEAPPAPPPLPAPARAEAPPPLPGPVSPAPVRVEAAPTPLPDAAVPALALAEVALPLLPDAIAPAPVLVLPDVAPAAAGAAAAPGSWRRAGFYAAVGAVSTLVGWVAGSVLNVLRGP